MVSLPDGWPANADLARVRVAAEDHVRGERWGELLELRRALEADAEQWVSLWAPMLAVATAREGGDGLPLLEEAVQRGFRQPEMFGDLLGQTFGADDRWAALREGMAAPPPPPGLELVEWPTSDLAPALVLERQPGDREEELAARLPPALPSAWDTAVRQLDWVHGRWEHANDHVERPDALEVLDRVERGDRFACVEYSIVLTQALNAVGIPARRVRLLRPDHHTGLGKSHQVSEAWVDDLGCWVVLDGQNGAWWTDHHDRPMSALTLQAARLTRQRATMRTTSGTCDEEATAWWFEHFATVCSTGLSYVTGSFVPLFQDADVLASPLLVRDARLAEPDLSQLATGIVDADGPAVELLPVHPYALGITIDGASTGPRNIHGVPAVLTLDPSPGEHKLAVATRTRYGVLRSASLVYQAR
jgi:transglutaminase-like putative cysteine protease